MTQNFDTNIIEGTVTEIGFAFQSMERGSNLP